MSRAMLLCSTPASAALLPCLPIALSRIVPIRASTTVRWPCPLGCNAWCGRIAPRPGVMFSIDTETGFRDAVLIHAAYALGDANAHQCMRTSAGADMATERKIHVGQQRLLAARDQPGKDMQEEAGGLLVSGQRQAQLHRLCISV